MIGEIYHNASNRAVRAGDEVHHDGSRGYVVSTSYGHHGARLTVEWVDGSRSLLMASACDCFHSSSLPDDDGLWPSRVAS